jgi:hypothetical protein
MTGLWIASTVVALAQYLRLREKRLIPLMLLYLLLALAESLEVWDWRRPWVQRMAVAAGFALLIAISPRHPRTAP